MLGQPKSGRSVTPTSDELLRLVVESATDFAIFTIDATGIITSWNIGAERLLGFAEEEIVGRDGDRIFVPEDRAAGAPEAERSSALAHGRAEDERWHLRKNGSRFWGSGLLMPLQGEVEGFVKILRDRTEQHNIEVQLRENEARFRLLATTIPQLVFRSLGTGERTWGSPQWVVYTGLSELDSLRFGWLDAVHPDDREATLAAWRDAETSGEYYCEHRIRRQADGEHRWHQTRAKPLSDGGISTSDWVGTSTDIHELRGLQDRQKVLLGELQHRTRNLLAVVQAIARQSLRMSTSLDEFSAEFESRLRALSRVQSLLARTDHHAIDLRDLVEAELAAHGADGGDPGRVRVDGPSIDLPATSAQTLALALHELATNAVKHGALGQPAGKLDVTWSADQHGVRRQVMLEWRESRVQMPPGDAPRRKGYGSELIERALPYQLKARTRLEFDADGVRCSIAVPVTVGEAEEKHG